MPFSHIRTNIWLENSLYGTSVSLVYHFFSAIQGRSQLLGTCDNVWYSNLKRLCLGCSTHLAHSIWQATEATPPINYSVFMALEFCWLGPGFWFRSSDFAQLCLHITFSSIQVQKFQTGRTGQPPKSNAHWLFQWQLYAISYIAGTDRRRIWLM